MKPIAQETIGASRFTVSRCAVWRDYTLHVDVDGMRDHHATQRNVNLAPILAALDEATQEARALRILSEAEALNRC